MKDRVTSHICSWACYIRDTQNAEPLESNNVPFWDQQQPLGPGEELSKDERGVSARKPSKNNQTGKCKECSAKWKMVTWLLLLLLLFCQVKSKLCFKYFKKEKSPFDTMSYSLSPNIILSGWVLSRTYQKPLLSVIFLFWTHSFNLNQYNWFVLKYWKGSWVSDW